MNQKMIRSLENQYGLDLSLHAQYLKWMWEYAARRQGALVPVEQPVSKLIGERRLLTV